MDNLKHQKQWKIQWPAVIWHNTYALFIGFIAGFRADSFRTSAWFLIWSMAIVFVLDSAVGIMCESQLRFARTRDGNLKFIASGQWPVKAVAINVALTGATAAGIAIVTRLLS